MPLVTPTNNEKKKDCTPTGGANTVKSSYGSTGRKKSEKSKSKNKEKEGSVDSSGRAAFKTHQRRETASSILEQVSAKQEAKKIKSKRLTR